MTLGQKIQRLRKEKRLTQEQLAERLHISRQAVSRWELDEVLPDTQNLLPLKEALGVSLDILLDPAQELEPSPASFSQPFAGQWKKSRWRWLWSLPAVLTALYYLVVLTGVLVRYGALARRLRSAAAGLLGILSVGVSHRLGRLGLDAADPVSQTETGAAIKKLPREIPREFFIDPVWRAAPTPGLETAGRPGQLSPAPPDGTGAFPKAPRPGW